tara:strand:+ start:1301 stop:1567 length:267 start_codon:yes stop_codon:yes gene_type:complete
MSNTNNTNNKKNKNSKNIPLVEAHPVSVNESKMETVNNAKPVNVVNKKNGVAIVPEMNKSNLNKISAGDNVDSLIAEEEGQIAPCTIS